MAGYSSDEAPIVKTLFVLAAIVIIVAGIKSTVSIVSPIIFAIFLGIIIAPIQRWLQEHGLSQTLSIIVMIIGVLLLTVLFVLFLNVTLSQLSEKIPVYQKLLTDQLKSAETFLKSKGLAIPKDISLKNLDFSTISKYGVKALQSLASGLSNLFLILIILIFMLIAAPILREKARKGLGVNNALLNEGREFTGSVRAYMKVSTLDNLFVSVLFVILLLILRVDFALLWGFLAFILSYIPTIGLVLAAAPAVILALIVRGPVVAIIVVAGAVIINTIGDNIITPRLATKELSLTGLTVILSFVIWSWLFGLLGGLLSVPLTLAVKAVLQSHRSTRWMAELMTD